MSCKTVTVYGVTSLQRRLIPLFNNFYVTLWQLLGAWSCRSVTPIDGGSFAACKKSCTLTHKSCESNIRNFAVLRTDECAKDWKSTNKQNSRRYNGENYDHNINFVEGKVLLNASGFFSHLQIHKS